MNKILSFFVMCAILKIQVQAQTVILSENFNSYNGKDSTVPPGWVFFAHGNYTSAGFSGSSGPNSYQFGKDTAYIITPAFSMADSISFWIKGTSTTSVLNRLILLGTSGNSGWDTIADMDSLPKSGKAVSYPVKLNHTKIKFVFLKTAGNLALDDVVLKATTTTGIVSLPEKEILIFQENSILKVNDYLINAITELLLFNSSGRIILRRQMQGSWSVDLSTLGTGLYIAEAKMGEKRYFKKIIIGK